MRARLAATIGVLTLAALLAPREASAQYKNFTFGFEGGYFLLTKGSELKPHNFGLGLFGGYKLSDQWWLTGRAMVSFPGQLDNAPNTVVLLHLTPVAARYYFLTDSFRPFVGITNAFHILINNTTAHDVFWGPGVTAGMEFKLKRDLYLGVEADAYWMFVFEGDDAQIVTATAQLIFFL